MTEEGRYKTMKNGAVYDLTAKRIVKGPSLTTADASALAAKRIDKRRAIARQAANEAVERDDFKAAHGDFAFIAALTQTAMLKATTPEDPKAIEAARFVLQVTGEAETPGQTADVPIAEMRGLLRDLAGLARAISSGGQSGGGDDDWEDGQAADVAILTADVPPDGQSDDWEDGQTAD
jgi:hypothetical protein